MSSTEKFQPMSDGIRALILFTARLAGEESWHGFEVDSALAEIRALNECHPYVGFSSGPPRIEIADDGFAEKGCWLFSFGAYGERRILAFGALEDALESAAEILPKGYFYEPELPDDFASLSEDAQELAYEEATADLTYTESGYLASWEWGCQEFASAREVAAWQASLS